MNRQAIKVLVLFLSDACANNGSLVLLCHIRIYALDPRFRGDDEAENPLKKGNRHSRECGDPEATNSELEM